MWKRDDAVKPTPTHGTGPATGQSGASTSVTPSSGEPVRTVNEPQRGLEKTTVNIGKSVVIKGELSGSEDLTIEGQVEGKIELRQNILTIGPNARIKAQVFAKGVVILGEITGNVTATEKVDIRDNGSVDGDIAAPRVAIAEGAHFRGSIDMQRTGGAKGDTKSASTPTASTASTSTSSASTGNADQKPQPATAGTR